jgi:hypothetical protein
VAVGGGNGVADGGSVGLGASEGVAKPLDGAEVTAADPAGGVGLGRNPGDPPDEGDSGPIAQPERRRTTAIAPTSVRRSIERALVRTSRRQRGSSPQWR